MTRLSGYEISSQARRLPWIPAPCLRPGPRVALPPFGPVATLGPSQSLAVNQTVGSPFAMLSAALSNHRDISRRFSFRLTLLSVRAPELLNQTGSSSRVRSTPHIKKIEGS